MGTLIKPAFGGGAVAAAGARVREYESMVANNNVSSSGNATKGGWFDVLTNITVTAVALGCRFVAVGDYVCYIAKEAATANAVDSIVATSVTIAGGVNMSTTGFVYMDFAAAFDLDAGERYFFALMRTDGTATTVTSLNFTAGGGVHSNDITPDGISNVTRNTIPAPGDNLGTTAGFVVPIHLTYTRR